MTLEFKRINYVVYLKRHLKNSSPEDKIPVIKMHNNDDNNNINNNKLITIIYITGYLTLLLL